MIMSCNISSLALACLVALTLLSPSYHAQDSSEDYTQAHNAARTAVGVGPVSWDKTLAAYAQGYNTRGSVDCVLLSSGRTYGQNIAWGSGNMPGTDAVALWVAEKVDYDFETNSCAKGKVCGHYTQVILSDSVRVGCAKVGCETGGTMISCNYDPPGNIIGRRPINHTRHANPPALSPSPSHRPSPDPKTSPVARKGKRRKMGLVVWLSIGGSCGLLLGFCCFCVYLTRKRRRERDQRYSTLVESYFGGEICNGTGPRKFSYFDLAKATKNFSEEEKLGEGGFGAVYKGFLKDLNVCVAVKRVSRRSKQGIKEYVSEVKIISRLRHKNLVKLFGWCHEKELLLAYEFMPNGSLDTHLFKGKSLLTWAVRYKIVQGLASTLLYLQEEAGDHCVLHRDIKSSNIMLDSSFNAKLGDFGLARLVDHAKGSQTTALAGTMGYMAPEYLVSGKASKELDIYSFGVVALEIACGRRSIEHNYDEGQMSLVPWVWGSYGNDKLLDAVDRKLSDFDVEKLKCLLIVGLWCAHPDRNLRPSIRQVIQVLNFESPLPNLPAEMPVARYDASITPTVLSSNSHVSCPSITVPR